MDVIIGIDPHKSSHTAVALDAAGEVLAELRVTAGKHQIHQLQTFAVQFTEPVDADAVWSLSGAQVTRRSTR
jgi:transposase